MVRWLKITVINDNRAGPGLKNDWGWSVLLESELWQIIFDADTGPDVIEHNFKTLRKNLKDLNFAFLSHYHLDHYGGFSYIGKAVPGLEIYVPNSAPPFLREWGLEPKPVQGPMKICDDVYSSGPMGSMGEQALGVKLDSKGAVVFVGCSHPGVDKLAKRIEELTGENIYLVIGGFHNPSRATLDRLSKFVRYIAPAHCSGDRARRYVEEKYPDKYIDVHTGSHFFIGND